MILALNVCFEGYTSVKVLDNGTSYREIYQAKNSSEIDAILTVYDMNKLPECFSDEKIPEFNIIPQMTNDAFPAYIESGHYSNDNVSLRWMITRYTAH